MLKGTKLYSIFTGTCPVCQNESMYTSSNLYNPSKTQEMHERCSHCNTKYKIEPSFFYGSMYVSYGVGIAIAMVAFVICYFLLDLSRRIRLSKDSRYVYGDFLRTWLYSWEYSCSSILGPVLPRPEERKKRERRGCRPIFRSVGSWDFYCHLVVRLMDSHPTPHQMEP